MRASPTKHSRRATKREKQEEHKLYMAFCQRKKVVEARMKLSFGESRSRTLNEEHVVIGGCVTLPRI